MSLFSALLFIPVAAGAINWAASTDGTNGIWSLSCDFAGQDLSNAVVRGDQCGSKCKATSGCTHYTWTSYNGGTCWMKKGPAFRTDAVDKNDKSMLCGLLPSWSNNWGTGCDFNGNDLSNAKTSADQCGPKCQQTTRCTHFTWTNYLGGTCWMKSGAASGLVAKTDNSMLCGVVSGSPVPPPPPPGPGGRAITVRNNCQEPVWMQSSHVFGLTKVNVGQTVNFDIPQAGWKSGMMWPKTGCDQSGNNCLFGQSKDPCPAGGCTPPAETKAEFTIPPLGSGDQSWYDITLVDGYSLPMTITPRVTPSGTCIATRCAVDLNQCPTGEFNVGDLRYRRNGKVVACLSPCKKWTWSKPDGMGMGEQSPIGLEYCCPFPDSARCNAGSVTSTKYVALVHNVCPSAYSFSYDDHHGLHYCPLDTTFDISLC